MWREAIVIHLEASDLLTQGAAQAPELLRVFATSEDYLMFKTQTPIGWVHRRGRRRLQQQGLHIISDERASQH